MKRYYSLIFLLILLSAIPGVCIGASGWKVYPAVHTLRALIRIGDDLWGATNAGLFRFNLQTETFQMFTTVEGLSSNDIRAIVTDGRGNLILGMGDAYLDIMNLSTFDVQWISDFKFNNKIFQIFALYNDSGTIYIGTDIGVSRLTFYTELDEYHIQGNYTHLGNFPLEIPVKAIKVHQGGLWVGTQMGLARGDLSSLVLESPASWLNFTTADGLSSNSVSALEAYRDTLYIATPATGLNYQSGNLFIPVPLLYTTNVNFLKAHSDTLYLGRPEGLLRMEPGGVVRYGPTGAMGRCVEFTEDSVMWAGFEPNSKNYGGLRRWSEDGWVAYAYNGPSVEQISDILVDNAGKLWVCGRQDIGINNGNLAYLDEDHWINFSIQSDNYTNNNFVSPDSFFWFQPRALTLDSMGSVWIGNDGRGVGWFDFSNDTVIAKGYYSAPSQRLFNIPGTNAHYCVVRDLTTDPWGNVWICNSEANPLVGPPIAIVPADYINAPSDSANWFYIIPKNQSGANLPQAQFYVDRLGVDSFGRIWFGANNDVGKGISILDYQGTFSELDDQWWTLENLPSDSIHAIVCDHDGVVWVATPNGVQYFYPEEDMSQLVGTDVFVPTGQNVYCIAIDPLNNKWFGTSSGLSVLASDNYTWLDEYNLTTWAGVYPSPLPNNVVQAIAFNSNTGEAFIGTDYGLVSISTPFKNMGATVSSVRVYPNPFLIEEGSQTQLFFDPAGLSASTEIKIFSVSGLLIRHLQGAGQINQGWDGRNSGGELTASGIYLILAYSADGQAKTGKVAVIRQ